MSDDEELEFGNAPDAWASGGLCRTIDEMGDYSAHVIPEVYGPPIPARAVLPLVGRMCTYPGGAGREPCRHIRIEGTHQQPGKGRYPDRLEFGRCPYQSHGWPCPAYPEHYPRIRVEITEAPEEPA